MNDSAPSTEPADTDLDELPLAPRDEAIPGFQPASRTRYRPSEAWALRWIGKPAT